MLTIPPTVRTQFQALLRQHAIPLHEEAHYLKWLNYYLDFCHKYHFPPASRESLPPFLDKLQEKHQSPAQREQAARAIALYGTLENSPATVPAVAEFIPKPPPSQPPIQSSTLPMTPPPVQSASQKPPAIRTADSHVGAQPPVNPNVPSSKPVRVAKGASWQAELTALKQTIQLRHYSPKTLKTYLRWARHFQAFTRSKSPELLSSDDVKAFLTSLAVDRHVSASSQNQAFNALLFFFRHVLHTEFGELKGVVRAKRKRYIPVVLSRREIDLILNHLEPPYHLVVKLLYGCGLRVFECLNLRVHCLNFEAGIVTIHDGKGQKDRTVPMPEAVRVELQDQLKADQELHQRDLAQKYAGVFLPHALDQKYARAAREWRWQWVFPAFELTRVPDTREYRRYHLHESHVQKAIKAAVEQAGIYKRVSPHTFRHCFASHLLQANYDIRTIQELLGHSDVRTTMIYTHTVKSVTQKEAKSPLDF